jgi:RNA polymerase sigma-54 factor
MSQGQIQSQTQAQTQTLSPQQILVVKLLELPTVELEERVHAELLDNPALEEGHEESESDDHDADLNEEGEEESTDYDTADDYRSDDDIPDYKLQDHNRSNAEQAEEIPISDTVSFFETLKEQLNEQPLDEHQHELAEYLIGSLDDDGLLRKPLDAMVDDLAIYAGIETDVKELEEMLAVIREFDPAGIGARSLQECLAIQIDRKLRSDSKNAALLLARRVIGECYDDFTRKRWERIAERLKVDEETLRTAITEITRLNPRPGASMGEAIGRNMQQIVPDFIIDTYDDGTVSVSLNSRNVPELRLSRDFSALMEENTRNKANQTKESREAFMFLKQKMDAAQGFIDAVKQRQRTLLTTMQTIVELQRPFFQEGDESLLRPMILKDVAERSHLDISTISRVSNSKYAQTNFGIYPLKFFFSDGYTNDSGEEMSVREVRRILKECIDGEDKRQPLTDDELSEILRSKGYPMARRTVAKYRQQLNIPVARLRR